MIDRERKKKRRIEILRERDSSRGSFSKGDKIEELSQKVEKCRRYEAPTLHATINEKHQNTNIYYILYNIQVMIEQTEETDLFV